MKMRESRRAQQRRLRATKRLPKDRRGLSLGTADPRPGSGAGRGAPDAARRGPWRLAVRRRLLRVTLRQPPQGQHLLDRLDCPLARASLGYSSRSPRRASPSPATNRSRIATSLCRSPVISSGPRRRAVSSFPREAQDVHLAENAALAALPFLAASRWPRAMPRR